MNDERCPDDCAPKTSPICLVPVEVPPLVIVAALAILVVSITVAIGVIVTTIPVVVTAPEIVGVSAIRLGISVLEPLAVVKAATLVANRGGRFETETREGVTPPCDQSIIEAPSLFH